MHRRRLEREDVDGTARFLTFSCYRRLPLFRNPAIRDRFVERLSHVAAEQRVAVLAWVVMPEHVHLTVYTEAAAAMTRFTHSIKRPFALEVLNRWRTLNAPILARLAHGEGHRFWQTGGGYDRNVFGKELLEKIDYTHGNPVKRGLTERPTDYRWSSASAYEGLPYVGPPIAFDLVPRRR